MDIKQIQIDLELKIKEINKKYDDASDSAEKIYSKTISEIKTKRKSEIDKLVSDAKKEIASIMEAINSMGDEIQKYDSEPSKPKILSSSVIR